MEFRELGKTGIQVSVVGLGGNNFGWTADLAGTRAIIDAAADNGITFIDTAISYGPSEELLGEVLDGRRDAFVIATKFGSPQDPLPGDRKGTRDYIATAVEASLKRLRTDRIDLYQLHFPDGVTPIEETLRALQDLLSAGKIRSIGCSNLPAAQLREAQEIAVGAGIAPFATAQDEYSLLVRGLEKELAPVIDRYGMSLLPYFPLANGVLTGKYKLGEPVPADGRLANAPAFFDPYRDPKKWQVAAELETFAKERGHTLLELAFSWLAAQPNVASIIAGASKAEQVVSNAHAASWTLSAADLDEVDRITGVLEAAE